MKRAVVAIAFSVFALPAAAQLTPYYVHSPKLICGKNPGDIVPRGNYFTVINVRNTSSTASTVIRKRFALTLPNQEPGNTSGWFDRTLPATRALRIDCPNVWSHLGLAPGTFIEGFVEIRSYSQLAEVWGVYSAGDDTGAVVSMHVERDPGRKTNVP